MQNLARKLARHSVPVAMLVVVLLLQWAAPAGVDRALQRLEGLLYDAKVQYLPPWPRSVSNIQIVDIDEASLQQIGRMPWDRQQFVRLTETLAAAGAVLVVYDVLFAESQPNSALAALQSWPQLSALPDLQRRELQAYLHGLDPDAQFAKAIGAVDVVLATLLHREGSLHSGQLIAGTRHPVVQQRPAGKVPFAAFSGYAGPVPVLAAAARGLGFINADADADGFVRRVALLHQFDQQLYPSLALEAFRVYSLLDNIEPLWLQQADRAYLQGIKLGTSQIRTDQQGRILVPYRGGARHYPYSSAADVLLDRIQDQRFDQAVVFVGTSATGLADLQATPTSLTFPGVEIHATVFDGLMTPQSLPYRPDWSAGATFMQLILLGIFCIWLFPRLGPLASVAAAILLLVLISGLNLWLWRVQVLDLPLLPPLLLATLLPLYFISYGFIDATRRRQQIHRIFGQYLPAAHIQRLLNDPAAASLAGEKKQLTVLFCDIRSFTTIAEAMPAQPLKLWLNQYFNALTQAIQAEGGTIDKYVGDMVMAFWGAPLAEPAHASKSIHAAFAMLKALQPLNQAYAAAGQPEARIGIGINSGEMNVGDMGSDFRRNYTVIGDAVNLGARLESLTKIYRLPLLVSAMTKALAPDFDYLLVDKVRVKGKQIPVQIYLPVAADTPATQRQWYQAFSKMLAEYFAADFAAAGQQLQQLSSEYQPLPAQTDLSGLLQHYQQRITAWQQKPPAADWDGSYSHD